MKLKIEFGIYLIERQPNHWYVRLPLIGEVLWSDEGIQHWRIAS